MCTFKINCAVLIFNVFKLDPQKNLNLTQWGKKNDHDWKMHKNVIPPCLHAVWFLHVLTRLANPRSFRSLSQINLSGFGVFFCLFCKLRVNKHFIQLSNIWAMCLLEESLLFFFGPVLERFMLLIFPNHFVWS